MKLNISQEDIDKARQPGCCNCPTEVAMLRQGFTKAVVGTANAAGLKDGKALNFEISKELYLQIKRYDETYQNDKLFQPGEYELLEY
jgi:diphthamide synthase (EF-2-diphthine--ammonia ligase)